MMEIVEFSRSPGKIAGPVVWPLTFKFDITTWQFLKIDMRPVAFDIRGKSDMTWSIS